MIGATRADGSEHPAPADVVTADAGGADEAPLRWSVHADEPLRSVWWQGRLPAAAEAWVHGWQSWSISGLRRLGVDEDPATSSRARRWQRAMLHPDADRPAAGSLRSESLVGVGDLWLAASSAEAHDTTFRLRVDDDGRVVVRVEAWLGGAVPGERPLHDVVAVPSAEEAVGLVAASMGARAGGRNPTGWCSWYQHFHDLMWSDVERALHLGRDWPFDVVQVDDAWQAAIGDWTEVAPGFPALDAMAGSIAAAGREPGLWWAPGLVSPRSRTAVEHPGWVLRDAAGDPVVANDNAGWGGDTWALDVTVPEVAAHVEAVARHLRSAGFAYQKLDFVYAAGLVGAASEPTATPAQRVRALLRAVRRGAGDDAFLLGCGAPLAPSVGLVDGMRIGPDVAPLWSPAPEVAAAAGGYALAVPSMAAAAAATAERQVLHRRWWVNDPDCLLLRPTGTSLTAGERERWATMVGRSGGMALVSDDLALLGADERRRFEEVVAAVRQHDHPGAGPQPPQ